MRTACRLIAACVLCSVAAAADPVDFDTDVVPLLSKAGCNAASCHGSAAGQAGFRLSLFGGDPAFDYRSIVNELQGRRVNHVAPRQSLVLAKPTGMLDHGGGERLDPDGDAARVIARWIEEGAKRRRLRTLERIIVDPVEFNAASVPASSRLTVTAVFSDGARRDVTRTAVYASLNEAALAVGDGGEVVVSLGGQHTATVRYGDQIAAFTAVSPLGSEAPVLPSSATANWIDELINAKLLMLRLSPAEPCADAAFVRRLSLDLQGRLPAPAIVERFVADASRSKRSTLIDAMLESDEFTDYWTHRLALQLRVQKPGADSAAAEAFYGWLRAQVAAGSGWDTIAAAVVLSEGDSHEPGAAAVHRYFPTAREEAEYMSEALMGVRLRCANCHNHPLDRWTQDDYHGLAAVFAGLDRGRMVRFTARGEVTHPRTGAAAVPRIPGERFLRGAGDERPEFAAWLTSPDNPYFARAMAGRVWEALMGRGLVSPVDDHRDTNPPTHPELLDELSRRFVEHDFKLRPLIREICNSAAYNRDGQQEADAPVDDRFYSRALAKPLSAEVLADAICDVTGVAESYAGVPRAINVADRTVATDRLGFLDPCPPGGPCTAGGGADAGVAAQLHLLNGAFVNARINNPGGRLQTLLALGASTSDIVNEFYLRALSRAPSGIELAAWLDRVDSTADDRERAARLEDFLWALLNCHEFTTNN